MKGGRPSHLVAVLFLAACACAGLLLLAARLRTIEDLRRRAASSIPPRRQPGSPAREFHPGRPGADTPAPPARPSALRRALADPAFLKHLAVLQKQSIDLRYRSLFSALNLDPARRARLVELLEKKQLVKCDAEAAAYDSGLFGTGAVIPAVAEAQSEVNGEIQQLLGSEGFRKYYDFEMTSGLRATLSRLQERLRTTSEPVSDAQVETMVGILDSASPPDGRGGVSQFTGLDATTAAGLTPQQFSSPLPENAPALLAPLLSPGQLEQLDGLVARQQEELKLRSARLISAQDPPGTAR